MFVIILRQVLFKHFQIVISVELHKTLLGKHFLYFIIIFFKILFIHLRDRETERGTEI